MKKAQTGIQEKLVFYDDFVKGEIEEEQMQFTMGALYDYFSYLDINGIEVDLMTALQLDLTDLMHYDDIYRLQTQQNEIIKFSGSTGSGKSLCMLRKGLDITTYGAQVIDGFPGLRMSNLFDTDAELIKRIWELGIKHKGTVLMQDEMDKDRSGMGTQAISSMLENVANRIRKLQFFILQASPSVVFSDHIHYYFETYGIYRADIKKNKPQESMLRCLISDRNNKLRGHVKFKIPPAQVIKQYDKRKDAILEKSVKFVHQVNTLIQDAVKYFVMEDKMYRTIKKTRAKEFWITKKYPLIKTKEMQMTVRQIADDVIAQIEDGNTGMSDQEILNLWLVNEE